MIKSRLPYHLRRYLPLFILAGLLGIGILTATLLTQHSQDIRHKAASSPPTVNLYLPTNRYLPPATNQSLPITALSPSSLAINGFQIVIELSGTIPSNLTITPPTNLITGLQLIDAEVIPLSTNSAQLRLAYITPTPTTPYITSNSLIRLASINFTSPNTGQLTVRFIPAFTIISQYHTNINLATTPQPFATYIFHHNTPNTIPQ